MDLSGVLDLSGVSVTALNTQFLQTLTELLQNKPQTKDEAVALYHTVTVQLSAYLVSNLPPLEQKQAALAMWLVKEVENVDCAKVASLTSWLCAPKKA